MIVTRDPQGQPNGYLVPIWSALSTSYRPDQVYMTAVFPGCVKGPHLHRVRAGYFCCVKGNALIVTRWEDGSYHEHYTGESYNFQPVRVAPGTSAAIYNIGSETALVLNMPTPAWSAQEPDEWPVENWSYTPHAD